MFKFVNVIGDVLFVNVLLFLKYVFWVLIFKFCVFFFLIVVVNVFNWIVGV